jgi:hypothetical protein
MIAVGSMYVYCFFSFALYLHYYENYIVAEKGSILCSDLC